MAGRILLEPTPAPRRAQSLALQGLVALASGGLAVLAVPLAKEVWTTSYTLVTAGWALLALAGLVWWLDGEGHGAPSRMVSGLAVFGRQALVAHVLAHLLSDLSIHVLRWGGQEARSLHVRVHGALLSTGLPAVAASLLYSLLMLGVVWTIVALAERRGWRLRL